MATAEMPGEKVAALRRLLGYLVVERQRLRSEGADRGTLEGNRRALATMQARLGRALAEEYVNGAHEQRAASPDQEETTAR